MPKSNKNPLLLLLLMACATTAAMGAQLRFDLSTSGKDGGRASISLGFAKAEFVFDIEQTCPESDACRADHG